MTEGVPRMRNAIAVRRTFVTLIHGYYIPSWNIESFNLWVWWASWSIYITRGHDLGFGSL